MLGARDAPAARYSAGHDRARAVRRPRAPACATRTELHAAFDRVAAAERLHPRRGGRALRGRVRRLLRGRALRRRRVGHGRAHARADGGRRRAGRRGDRAGAHLHRLGRWACMHAGATPVFCDVEDGTGLLDPDSRGRADHPAHGRAARRSTSTGRRARWTRSTQLAAPPWPARLRGRRPGPRRDATADARAGSLGHGGRVLLLSEQEPRRARRRRRDLHGRRR